VDDLALGRSDEPCHHQDRERCEGSEFHVYLP
jgi:hypothetical protein